jgi:hypothetical protein
MTQRSSPDTAEVRILQNQVEIMWTLSYLLKCAAPDLVGKGGELDRMCQDLVGAAKDTARLLEGRATPPTTVEGT